MCAQAQPSGWAASGLTGTQLTFRQVCANQVDDAAAYQFDAPTLALLNQTGGSVDVAIVVRSTSTVPSSALVCLAHAARQRTAHVPLSSSSPGGPTL